MTLSDFKALANDIKQGSRLKNYVDIQSKWYFYYAKYMELKSLLKEGIDQHLSLLSEPTEAYQEWYRKCEKAIEEIES